MAGYEDAMLNALVPGLAGGFLGGMAAGLFLFFLIIAIASYLYTAFALMTIAQRLKHPRPWLAWIPLVNFFLVAMLSEKPWWFGFVVVFAWVPFVGGLIVAAATIWFWWRVAARCKYPSWTSILMIIPLVQWIMIGLYAWQNDPKKVGLK